MSTQDDCVLLAVPGDGTVLTSWLGHRSDDPARDVALMLTIGTGLMVGSGVLVQLGA